MLQPKVTQLPGHIQSIYVQNILKLYSRVLSQAEAENDTETVAETSSLLLEKLPMFVQSADLEVQERVCHSFLLDIYVLSAVLSGLLCTTANEIHSEAARQGHSKCGTRCCCSIRR
jgi:AP-3 complex subunit delta-1